ncbi:MAG: Histidyl-tRNA synthetase [uncultured Sphingosinicella sp.]|uniref:Histidine--tRNA ligase n=1 Tax=uncultured Sphingosinicella sp. TaxID=478748 RepID=A0A6J4U7P5_9SPHN|nr:histidine--tRNA ligase [uncultured Sphingosinicella sp.]CAA9540693.1 MAG: Histidyl-tRNA synthetase [uncultured Sphingosinicella sp.]
MSKGPQRIRGTQDIWGEEADRFARVVETFDRVRRLYAFQRIELPVFEATEVFARSIGETTDIVSKEMYTFPDRGGDSLTLRPEFTAGICRAYLSEGWQQHAPIRLATHGPVFRYERPQKGRFRQFHQLDAEIIGTDSPLADVELLVLADQLLHQLGISEGVTLQLNTLGDAPTRDAWRAALVSHFEAHRSELSEDSLVRLAKNPLRILDSKDPRDRPAVDSAPSIDEFLTPEASAFFARVTAGLNVADVSWTRNPRLVRGLDYYRHTAFEFVTDRLGAQGTVLAGGRYDGLIEGLGGPHTPAVGWAAGIERLAMMLTPPPALPPAIDVPVVVMPVGDAAEATAIRVATAVRRRGFATEIYTRGNLKKRLARASERLVSTAIIIGDDELEAGQATVRHLRIQQQDRIPFDRIVEQLWPTGDE